MDEKTRQEKSEIIRNKKKYVRYEKLDEKRKGKVTFRVCT
jgi:hypothetical protein